MNTIIQSRRNPDYVQSTVGMPYTTTKRAGGAHDTASMPRSHHTKVQVTQPESFLIDYEFPNKTRGSPLSIDVYLICTVICKMTICHHDLKQHNLMDSLFYQPIDQSYKFLSKSYIILSQRCGSGYASCYLCQETRKKKKKIFHKIAFCYP